MPITIAALPPAYLPDLAHFDLMARVDQFVHMDAEPFDQKRNHHRALIRSRLDSPFAVDWLTVGLGRAAMPPRCPLNCVTFARHGGVPMARHGAALLLAYCDADHLSPCIHQFDDLVTQKYESLADLNVQMIAWLADMLEIHTPTSRASALELNPDQSYADRLLLVCRNLGATRLLCPEGDRRYIDIPAFRREGVEIKWHVYANRPYRQHRRPFVPRLSAIDYLLCNGPGWPGRVPLERI